MKIATCSACLHPFGEEEFSRNQWKKRKDNNQRCPSCVENYRYTAPIMETMMMLQHLPPCLRGRVLEMSRKDDPLNPLLLGMITSADAFAEFSGLDIFDFIMSPKFAEVMKKYQDALDPSISAQAKIAEQAEKIRRLEEEISYLEHAYESLESRHASRKSRCTHFRRLFETEILGSEYFFRQTSKMMKALLRISRRSETPNTDHQGLGHYYRTQNVDRPSWEQAMVQGARENMITQYPVMRPFWRVEPDSRGLICLQCSSRGFGARAVRHCGCQRNLV